GGPLRGDNPGVRLIEPDGDVRPAYDDVPFDSIEAGDGDWLVVPLHHIFASETLSARAPAIAARAPDGPRLLLNPGDADRLGLGAGDTVALVLGDERHRASAVPMPGLPQGLAGFLVGLPGQDFIALPARGRLQAEGAS
ncbi:MAG TPA: NADH-quinone oxidoreductase subunit G, partial [Alphaproteobacteria bacterium]|nr:NADH-quinone oxidoreductase subunit G [Alphaproteobacteria bacterium]